MKILLPLAILLLSSCSTTLSKFDQGKNCSSRALEHIGNSSPQQLVGSASSELFKASQQCYREVRMNGYNGNHNVCVVLETNKSGNITFMDIADNDNSLDNSLRNCMIDKMQTIDFRDNKAGLFLQPITLSTP